MRPRTIAVAILAAAVLLAPRTAAATDVDGPDCGRPIQDFGDAPESVPLPWGPIAHFPSCLAPGAPGTQELVCPPRSSAPGATGYMKNVQDGQANYWIGCFQTPAGALYGIDSEADAKVAAGGGQPSHCDPGVIADCTDGGPSGPIGADECIGDPSDAGVAVNGGGFFFFCGAPNFLNVRTANCGPDRTAYLNVLIDMNADGDWNDNLACVSGFACPCPPGCLHEWVVKNLPVAVPNGCGFLQTPTFDVPFSQFAAWTRVSLTDGPVDDDYPWAGSANRPGGAYSGGETEDYPFAVTTPDPARRSTWGTIKARYR